MTTDHSPIDRAPVDRASAAPALEIADGSAPDDPMTAPRWGRSLVLGLWVVAVVGWLVISRSRGVGPAEAADRLRDVLASGAWGPILYIVIYALRPVILFPASVLTVLGGLVFGPFYGVVYTIIGSNLSTAATYVGARFVAGRRA